MKTKTLNHTTFKLLKKTKPSQKIIKILLYNSNKLLKPRQKKFLFMKILKNNLKSVKILYSDQKNNYQKSKHNKKNLKKQNTDYKKTMLNKLQKIPTSKLK